MKRNIVVVLILLFFMIPAVRAEVSGKGTADKLPWWPTDAQPAPVKDEQKGGFWWWPSAPGTAKGLWGNRGYAYVNKIIYDWRGSGTVRDVQVKISDVGFVETEDKPSLLVKRMIRRQRIQFKGNAVEMNPEQIDVLKKVVDGLKRNKGAHVLVAAYQDASALEGGRIQVVEKFLADQGILQERIHVLAPEKFKEAGLSAKQSSEPGTIQFVTAEIQEVMIPGPK
ncbi:MAG: hypothetical protein V2A70_08305 [Candidatus Omnitrophota bacterium]